MRRALLRGLCAPAGPKHSSLNGLAIFARNAALTVILFLTIYLLVAIRHHQAHGGDHGGLQHPQDTAEDAYRVNQPDATIAQNEPHTTQPDVSIAKSHSPPKLQQPEREPADQNRMTHESGKQEQAAHDSGKQAPVTDYSGRKETVAREKRKQEPVAPETVKQVPAKQESTPSSAKEDAIPTKKWGIPPKVSDAKACTASDIFRAWIAEYDIETKAKRTLAGPSIPGDASSSATKQRRTCASVPAAPHLRCCDEIDALRRMAEKRNPDGSLPAWALPQPAEAPKDKPHPRPPWIRGSPRENLPLTHQVQADIWANQFPPDNCQSPNTRYLMAWWDDPRHGIGSHIHLMSGIMGLALKYNRVFMYTNYSYHRGQHEGCKDHHWSNFECYFVLPTSKECSDKAMQAFLGGTREWRSSFFYDYNRMKRTHNLFEIMASNQPYVVVSPKIFQVYTEHQLSMPTKWGTPWKDGSIDTVLGGIVNPSMSNDTRLEKNWWRAQCSRFLLRWPSPYLCHSVNFAMHQTFGMEAAASAARTQVALRSRKACSKLQAGAASAVQAAAKLRSLPAVRLPRPIIRMHVRGSDKGIEMRLFSFDSYMGVADKLKASSLPNASTIWLSSEEQSPFNSLSKFPKWKFYYLQMERKRQEREVADQWTYAKRYGLRDYVDASFCNLVISSECDAFVLALGSNWDRLVNELRLTGGRLHAPVSAVNCESGEF